MDKVLAFSILSASPADISAGGAGARWTRLSWRTGADADQAAGTATQQQQQENKEKERQRSCSHDGGKGGGAAAAFLPRFAPEFDGIDCFETIVSH